MNVRFCANFLGYSCYYYLAGHSHRPVTKNFCRLCSVCLQTSSVYLLRRSAKGVSPHAERSAPSGKVSTNSLSLSESEATTFIISKSHNSRHVVTSSSFLLPSAFSRGFRNFTQSLYAVDSFSRFSLF